MATFMIKRGKRALYRTARAHLAQFNQHGEIVGTWCGAVTNLNSNVPWGLKTCRHCVRRATAASEGARG